MAIDTETFRWCAGGFFTGLAVLTTVAYQDPKFFQSWVFNKLVVLVTLSYVVLTSFWLGAKTVKDYVINQLSLSKSNTEMFENTYANLSDIMQWLVIASVIAIFWTILLQSLSSARQKNSA